MSTCKNPVPVFFDLDVLTHTQTQTTYMMQLATFTLFIPQFYFTPRLVKRIFFRVYEHHLDRMPVMSQDFEFSLSRENDGCRNHFVHKV